MASCVAIVYLLYGCTILKVNALGVEDWVKAQSIANYVESASTMHDVPEDILLGVMRTESSFNKKAVSSAGAVGLMQVKPKYWAKNCPALKEPRANVHCGAMILRQYKDQLGTWDKALVAYNIGITNFRKGRNLSSGWRYLGKVKRAMRSLT